EAFLSLAAKKGIGYILSLPRRRKGSYRKMSLDHSTRTGRYAVPAVGGERVEAFIPPALPPDPRIRMEEMFRLMGEAGRAVGRLDGVTSILPDTPLFLYMYIRKEALLSSQIEGTQ